MSGFTGSWQRSTFCADSHCVEVASVGDDVFVRDSKDENVSPLRVSKQAWNQFLDAIVAGEVPT